MPRHLHPSAQNLLAVLLLILSCRPEGSSQAAPLAATGGVESLSRTGAERRLRAAFLIVDGVYNTELTAPFDVLGHSMNHVPDGLGIDVFTVSPDGEPVTTAEGLTILPDFSFESAPSIDILVVASAEGSRDSDLKNRTLVDWVRRSGKEAQVVMSLCWGAFLLAEADLLEDRKCTTFPGDYGTFARRFPQHRLMVNVSFVHDRDVITSQGGARSFDAAMYLVEVLYGLEAAQGIGSGLLIPWPPDSTSGITYHVATASGH